MTAKEKEIFSKGLEVLISCQIAIFRLEEFTKLGAVVHRPKQHLKNAIKQIRAVTDASLNKMDKYELEEFNSLLEGYDRFIDVAKLSPELQYNLSQTFDGQNIDAKKFFALGFSMLLENSDLGDRKEINKIHDNLKRFLK